MMFEANKQNIDPAELDVDHELPAAEDGNTPQEKPIAGSEGGDGTTAAVGESSEVERLRDELNKLNDRYLRSLADADNARKRTMREMADLRTFATVDALRAFLPVIDGLERALNAPSSNIDDLRKGIELIYKQTLEAARRLGMEPIDAKGKQFDPHFHEAVETVDSDRVPDQTVIDELQRGYKLKDRLVRPSMVRVARNPKQ